MLRRVEAKDSETTGKTVAYIDICKMRGEAVL
jgi:hypothetical protein